MSKLKGIISIALMAVMVVISYVGIGYAQSLMPDYLGDIDEVQIPIGLSPFTFAAEDDVLWPWDRYQEESVSPALDYLDRYGSVNDFVYGLFYSFIDDTGEIDMDFSPLLVQSYNEKQGNMYYLKDVAFADSDSSVYSLNLAFNNDEVVYFSLVRRNTAFGSIESGNVDPSRLQGIYQVIRSDYETAKKALKQEGGFSDSYASESEIMQGEYDEGDAKENNCFMKFLYTAVSASSNTENYGRHVPYDTFVELIANGANTGVAYANDLIRVEFQNSDYSLTLFYSPDLRSFTGFSLRPN